MALGEQVVGSLWVTLGLDHSGLDAGFEGANKSMVEWRDGVNKNTLEVGKWATAIGATAAPLLAVAYATNAAAQAAAKYGDTLHDLSLTTLMTERNLQRLKYAVDATGGNFETFAGSVSFLAKNIESAKDPTSRQAEALKELGIRAADTSGHVRNMDSLLPQIIDKLHNMRDKTKAAHLEMELFGKNTGEVAKVVELGSAGLNAYGDEAERLGLILSPEQLAQQRAFNDEWAEMNTQLNLVYIQLGTAVLPLMQEVTTAVKDLTPAISILAQAVGVLVNAFVMLAEAEAAVTSVGAYNVLTGDYSDAQGHLANAQSAYNRLAGTSSTPSTTTSTVAVSRRQSEYDRIHGAGSYLKKLGGSVPAMAEGGIVTRPTLALVGESGPEAIVPLSKGRGAGGINITQINNARTIAATPAQMAAIGRQNTRALLRAIRTQGG